MKFIRNTFLIIWTVFCFVGVVGNFSNYILSDWLFIIPFILIPYLLIWFISLKTTKPKSYNVSKNEPPTDTNTQPPQYIETGNAINRVDGKAISDEEVPYLIQIGYENALREHGLYTGQVLDLSFMQERDAHKKEYTTLPTYNEICNIQPKEVFLSSTDIFFLKYLNGRTLENPNIAQYWFYDYNLNYSEEIKKLISSGLLYLSNINIEKFKVDELKTILRHFSLPISGKKQDLQKRIYENVSYDDLSTFSDDSTHYFSVTPKGMSLINHNIESATQNLELENSCIDFIINGDFKSAHELIQNFKHSVPAETHTPYIAYNTRMDELYSDIMDSSPFNYTLEKDRDIELQIRAAVIFCRMYGSSQTDIIKIIKRMYIENDREFSDDAKNIISGRLL